ncbi:hypothetical protein X798_02587 [Onchocerca flexuosa]|uniref:Uncharacterized protein n=1 Tax=Onchocerca flexuosa TaxID=387005 RepID=A0A238BZZ0_9BILA|nr:hypothetical protein X798_02587 [Onchocerca flexuosa]
MWQCFIDPFYFGIYDFIATVLSTDLYQSRLTEIYSLCDTMMIHGYRTGSGEDGDAVGLGDGYNSPEYKECVVSMLQEKE